MHMNVIGKALKAGQVVWWWWSSACLFLPPQVSSSDCWLWQLNMTILAELRHWPPGQTRPIISTNNIFTTTWSTTINLTILHVNSLAVLKVSSADRALIPPRGSYCIQYTMISDNCCGLYSIFCILKILCLVLRCLSNLIQKNMNWFSHLLNYDLISNLMIVLLTPQLRINTFTSIFTNYVLQGSPLLYPTIMSLELLHHYDVIATVYLLVSLWNSWKIVVEFPRNYQRIWFV